MQHATLDEIVALRLPAEATWQLIVRHLEDIAPQAAACNAAAAASHVDDPAEIFRAHRGLCPHADAGATATRPARLPPPRIHATRAH